MPHSLGYSPSDYIARFEANTGFGMVPPSRHEDWRVRAIWFKRLRIEHGQEMEDFAHPSWEWDKAFDDYITNARAYENVVTSQWLARASERANRAVVAAPAAVMEAVL
jgi:hypothetical protein